MRLFFRCSEGHVIESQKAKEIKKCPHMANGKPCTGAISKGKK